MTYKGKPVPAGTVVFIPDHSRGNRGLSVTAEIKNGSFVAEAGNGVFGGPYTVVVNGCDGNPAPTGEGGMDERGKPLFTPYEMKTDLPGQEHILNIDVPEVAPTKAGPTSLKGRG